VRQAPAAPDVTDGPPETARWRRVQRKDRTEMNIARTKRGFLKKAVMLAVGAAATVAVVAPADAALASCRTDYACLYSNADFGGYKYETFYSTTNLGNVNYGGTSLPLYSGDGVNSNVSSLDNWDFDSPITVYYNSGYRGPCFEIPAGGAKYDFASVRLSNGKTANDNMNSFHFNYHC
jgi:hypothetical protein